MENEIKNKEENMHLMRSLSELEDGEYNVSTSRGNFKIEKITKLENDNYSDYYSYRYDIKITDENGNLFSHYYFSENRKELDFHTDFHTYENEIDIPDKINFVHGYEVDYNNHNIKVYLDNEHTEYYLVSEKDITKWKNTTHEHLARISDNKILGQNLAIDLKNFDRMIFINYLNFIILARRYGAGRKIISEVTSDGFIRVSKNKDIEKELNAVKEKISYIENDEYLKNIIDKKLIEKLGILDLNISDIKQEEKKLVELSKIYLKTMNLRNNTHELNTMKEILTSLDPEFNRLVDYIKFIKKYNSAPKNS